MLVIFERCAGIILLLCSLSHVTSLQQYRTPGRTLYVAEEGNTKSINVNRFEDAQHEDFPLKRDKRDVSVTPTAKNNISTWTTHLNDSHQQLMVHWVGEGSNVIICLARDSTPRNKGGISPSALFISYDYGKNFTNKTESFRLANTSDADYAQLEKFFNHPKYPEFCVFVDTTNKKLFYTSDNGRNIHRSDLTFHPSELAFDEELPDKFVVLDKVDPNRPLFITLDGGKTFKQIHALVKTFFWSSGTDFPKTFYVERWEPNGTSTVLVTGDPINLSNAKVLFKDAKDFQIKGDYMFATKQSKERNTLDLYISHQRKPFYKAEFETELDLRKFHVADVTDERIFVSVMHTENLADLYVSEINNNFTQYRFVMSMEQILCYFPEGNWKNSWLEDVTEDPFTDLYKVEGLKGIYIASKVESKAPVANIGPEHIVSLITFDHGVTWSPINPPTEDENGKPLSCHIENSCSLHLCQKFSQLYPVTRSANIMSSKSAPGIIMATGVMGKSLKGIPGVYLSRDAGLTWKRILKDYYFFNYGDHGGVLVAVKYFKARGETRNIRYSTNEGYEWKSYQFNDDDLRMYGLMTEPGENTTTFTMFGSANDQHQWIIITTDLRNVFDRNCTQDDYKYWSPSPPNMTVSCVLGQRDVFHRRLAHANCYNGIDYNRQVKKEVCECGRRDFECDYGFMHLDNECVQNKSMKYDPYVIPSDCRPGHFYKRTKGYRKIDGDVCTISSYLSYAPDMIPCPLEESTEFMLVALRDKIALIDLSDNSTLYPVKGQNNIVAIEFDMKNNCIYWADIELDKISRQCFNNATTQEVIVDTDLASIEGMALDWISNVLFFVDGMRKKIEAVRTDLSNEGRMRVTILDHKVLSKPRGIAVHPKAGYLFWTDWDRNSPSVSRSNLDGTNVKKLFGKPVVKWPNGITIDQMSERIYWVDAMEDYIASADLNGRYFRRILWNDDKVSHPFAVAVLKDKMFWDDWKAKSIFIADKDSGANLITINDSFSGLMDLKVFAHFVQYGSNACSYKNTSCDTLCLGGPGNTFSCLCPDGFTKINGKCLCPNGMEPAANMTCPKKAGAACGTDQFSCKNGMCISLMWRCDGNNDCGDLSDEIRCPMCSPPMISCDDDTRCYLPHWKCDGDVDCADMSDEKDCAKHNCTETQFQCNNGQCIDSKWMCDGDNDCKDGSDERNCTTHIKRTDTPVSCTDNTFPCGNGTNAICIPTSWVCDGERDCAGGEDESAEQCKDSTCAPYMFRCPTGKCIFKSWVCDGENDCGDDDSADEKNCTSVSRSKLLPRPTTESTVNFGSTCLDWMFKCSNGNCVPYWWRCDSVDDCGDNSDELGCGIFKEPTSVRPIHDITRQKCGKNKFTCSPGECIPLEWVCDTAKDCLDGSDERGCTRRGVLRSDPCGADETPCVDGRGCVLSVQVCDGTAQCADGSDESRCYLSGHELPVVCPPKTVFCDDGSSRCIIEEKVCDGYPDCFDGTDEENCSNDTVKFHQSIGLGVEQITINSTSFLISCWVAQPKMVQYSFLPSISKVSDGKWRNLTWITDTIYRFTDLEPFTNYNVTIYIRDNKSNKIYASMKYVNTTTGQGVPSPPTHLTITQIVGSRVVALWDPPKEPRGIIKSYTLKYAPPLPPIEKIVHVSDNNKTVNITINGYFKPNVNYSFWVVATNDAFTSNTSTIMNITFDEVSDVDDLSNVSLTRKNDSSVFLTWHKIRGVEGYKVAIRTPPNYAKIDDVSTKQNNVTLTNLPPGVQVYIDVMAYKGTVTGKPFTIPLLTDGSPNPELSNVVGMLLKEKGNSVKLSWSPPVGDKYKNMEFEYEVQYVNVQNYGSNQNVNATKMRTKNTTVTIDNLHACEGYVFSVGLVGGPQKVVEIITRENERAPIKNLHFSVNEATGRLHILWNANCDVIRNPVTYRLDIIEETQNKTNQYELKATKNVSCSHIIKKLPVGGRYSVCIYTALEGSVRTCERVRAREVVAPDNVMALRSKDGHVMVNWHQAKTNNANDHKQKYEVILSEKEIPDDMLHPSDDMKVVTAESSPMWVHYSSVDGPLYVAVRTITDDGYYSDLSEVHTLEMGEGEEEYSSASALWWGGGAALVVGIALAVALVHLALKHRRLARSFLRFTAHTPRYDSRRGQATIADHDEDDVPPIQGFSDDEPLVIA